MTHSKLACADALTARNRLAVKSPAARRPGLRRVDWILSAALGASSLLACGNSQPAGNATGGTGGASTSGGSSGTGGTSTTGGASGSAGSAGKATSSGGSSGNLGSGSGGTAGATVGSGGAGSGAGTGSGGAPGTGGSSGTGGSAGGSGGMGTAGLGPAGGNPGVGGMGGMTSGTAGSGQAGGASGAAGNGGSTVTCPSAVLKSGDTNETVQVGSMSRTYILHVPSAYKGTAAVPLVVDFHPLGGTGSQEEGSSPYKAQTDPEGVISAYPNGLSGPSGGAWNVGPCCVANVDDVAFAKALVAQVETKACIDTKRVYAVGFSMGGGMSHYLACHAADVFAAVAPASFDLLKENEDDCKPPRPIAEISFRSSNDTVVPYAGGYSSVVSGMPVTFLGAVGTFQKWAEIDGCTGSPTATDSNDCQYYTSCSGGVQIGLCTMNAGHAPGEANIGWPFIKKYTLP